MALEVEDTGGPERKYYIMILLCQLMGTIGFNRIPSTALLEGAMGYMLVFFAFQICVGIPLVYMEFIIGQFTQRDCIDIWKIRPFLSHIGYFLIIWQICIVICNHAITSLIFHYFLITFERPIPYYTCGYWSTKNCNILIYNYTVNQDCIKLQGWRSYCADLYKTFPEYQYLRLNLVKSSGTFQVAWKVLLASGLNCLFIYASCLRRRKSLNWTVGFLAIYPMATVMFIMLSSLRQKGIVVKCVDALNLDFKRFESNFSFTNLVRQAVYSLGVGTGLSFNLASSSSFRSPCFSNIVISVVIVTVFVIFCILTVAMISCPYSYVYGISPDKILSLPMSLTFEKLPRLLFEYDKKMLYLIVVFSCYSILGLCTSVTVFYNILEVMFRRSPTLERYPGLTSLCGILILFFATIPLFSDYGLNGIAIHFKQYVTLISTFIAMLECLIFVIWYGLHKFSEDVHFMLGIQPNILLKLAWIGSFCILTYSFIAEVRDHLLSEYTDTSRYGVATTSALIILSCCLRCLIAACRKQFLEIVTMDQNWGPKDEVLQRSRTMFSAQAMTKEYIYRQHHLQAGIIKRQQKSNIRDANPLNVSHSSPIPVIV